jgi:hypothetical protein
LHSQYAVIFLCVLRFSAVRSVSNLLLFSEPLQQSSTVAANSTS